MMEQHVENITEIVTNALKEKGVPVLGLQIHGTVSANIFEELHLWEPLFFDEMKVKDMKAIARNIHHLVQNYLIENKIKEKVYIEPNVVFGRVDGVSVYMKCQKVIK